MIFIYIFNDWYGCILIRAGGGRKKSKLFSRWLPWRSGSAAAGAAAVSASSSAAASGAAASVASSAGASLSTSSASPGSSTRQAQSNTVRRTSPVDSNLGDEPPDDRLPTPPPSPPPPLTPLTPLTPLAPLAPLAPLTPLLDTASRRQRFHAGVGGSLKLARRFKPNPTLTPDGDDYDQLFTKVNQPGKTSVRTESKRVRARQTIAGTFTAAHFRDAGHGRRRRRPYGRRRPLQRGAGRSAELGHRAARRLATLRRWKRRPERYFQLHLYVLPTFKCHAVVANSLVEWVRPRWNQNRIRVNSFFFSK